MQEDRIKMKTIQTLIHDGRLNVGDVLVWARRSKGVTFQAVVLEDGSIQTEDNMIHRSPSGAARHCNSNKPVDGWLAWKLKRTGQSLTNLRS